MPKVASGSSVLIVTPYLAGANNGNWRTAERWGKLLSRRYHIIVQGIDCPGIATRDGGAIAMIGLHARRSRRAIAAWKKSYPDRPLIVALTGTDLYRDLPAGDIDTSASINDADRLIVLQEDARRFVPSQHQAKVDVVVQSARALVPWQNKREDRLQCVFVAHLRPEKDPATVMAAWRALPSALPIYLTVIGEALDADLGDALRDLARADARVRWLGALPHAKTRQAIRRAHLLLCPSRMEGGANVVVEAITAGTFVVASRVSGNIGMLGGDYGGYFSVGDASALAHLLISIQEDRVLRKSLESHCQGRRSLFTPDEERAALMSCITSARAGEF